MEYGILPGCQWVYYAGYWDCVSACSIDDCPSGGPTDGARVIMNFPGGGNQVRVDFEILLNECPPLVMTCGSSGGDARYDQKAGETFTCLGDNILELTSSRTCTWPSELTLQVAL